MTSDRPNILFIFPDQLGAPWLGCYGNSDMVTPNIDQFAKENRLFENAYTACPLCTPYRGMLFTGRYPCQTGITDNNYRLPKGEKTIAHMLSEGGYFTSYVGKWHLSGEGKSRVGGITRVGSGKRWIAPEDRGGFQQFLGWESGHVDHWKGEIWEDDPNGRIDMPGHETDALADMLIERLDGLRKRDQPFCLFAAFQSPHPPCAPAADYHALYKGKTLNLRPNVSDGETYQVPEWGYNPDLRTFIDSYCGEISHFDTAFGRILKALDDFGLSENTVVILTSDHGEMAGSHGLFGKGTMYEEAVHVPLIVRYPNGRRQERTDAFVSTVDFLPTLLDIAQVPPAPTAEGISYAPLLRGERQETRQSIYMIHEELCIRTGMYKLMTDMWGRSPVAFFDLTEDTYEMDNRVYDARYTDTIEMMRQDLQAWLDDVLTRVGRVGEASGIAPVMA